MNDLSIALITIFGTVASVTGVALFVFNGTKNLIREIHEAQKKMDERAEQRHKEILQQHQDIVELLKKGFGGAGTVKM